MIKVTIDITGEEVEKVLDLLGAVLEEEEEIKGHIDDDDDIIPVSLDDLMEYVKHKHSCCGKCHNHGD